MGKLQWYPHSHETFLLVEFGDTMADERHVQDYSALHKSFKLPVTEFGKPSSK